MRCCGKLGPVAMPIGWRSCKPWPRPAPACYSIQVETVVAEQEGYELLRQVPYAGPATLGIILAVTGDVASFRDYRQYVAYTGYFAGLEKSQTIDGTRMSRRNNRDLKRALFQIAAPLVWFDHGENAYQELYQRNKAEGRPWHKATLRLCSVGQTYVSLPQVQGTLPCRKGVPTFPVGCCLGTATGSLGDRAGPGIPARRHLSGGAQCD